MGATEKQSLINTLVVTFVEDYGLNLKEVRGKITEVLQQYHVTISDEAYAGNDLSTEYLLKKFKDGKTAVGMSERTILQYAIAIKKLEQFTKKTMKDMEAEDINNFLRAYGKTVSSVTLRGKYQLISSVFNWLFNHKYLPANPILYVDAPKITVIYKEPLTELEFEKVKKACEQLPEVESLRAMALIHFLTSTGCRVSELCNLTIADVDLNKKVCKVMGKGKKERPVVLTDRAIYRLQLYLNTRKDKRENAPLFAHIRGEETNMTKDGMERIIHKLRELSGVTKITCHTFRRFYATELRRRNVNIQMIASSLGHANLNQINRYSLYNKTEMLDVIRASM